MLTLVWIFTATKINRNMWESCTQLCQSLSKASDQTCWNYYTWWASEYELSV